MVGRLLILYFKLRDAAGATASCPCLRMWLTMQSTSLVIPSFHLYQLSVKVYILHFLGHINGALRLTFDWMASTFYRVPAIVSCTLKRYCLLPHNQYH